MPATPGQTSVSHDGHPRGHGHGHCLGGAAATPTRAGWRAAAGRAGQGGVGSSQGQGSGTDGRGISWSQPERGRAPRRHSQMPISPGMVGMYLLLRRCACIVAALYLLSGCTASSTQLDENSLALRSGCGVLPIAAAGTSSPAEVMPPVAEAQISPS